MGSERRPRNANWLIVTSAYLQPPQHSCSVAAGTPPDIGTPTHGDRRSHPFRRYPYSVIYKPMEPMLAFLSSGTKEQSPSTQASEVEATVLAGPPFLRASVFNQNPGRPHGAGKRPQSGEDARKFARLYFALKYHRCRPVSPGFTCQAQHLHDRPPARPPAPMTISTEARTFFVSLGERIAALRRTNKVTQTQLAQALGVSQQTLQSYEVGRRRIPASALPVVARTLRVSVEPLFSAPAHAGNRPRRARPPKWQQQIEALAQLPTAQQRGIIQMLQTALAQAAR